MNKEDGMMENWHNWKQTLGSAVNLGEGLGLSEDTINNASYMVGNFLTSFVEPRNKEEALLQKLWKEADEDERKSLAKVIVKMVDKT